MDREQELAVVRRAYAKQILAVAQVEDAHLEAAFAQVRREDFLGPGPWMIGQWFGPDFRTPTADPVFLYVDNIVKLVPERRINNGLPSNHAKRLGAAAIERGAHVVHVGAGTGYYTAIMAELVGASGKVTAIEYDGALAARASANLAAFPHVQVIHGDGASASFDVADVIYVNAGTTRPVDRWLDGLAQRGRLILPLTTNSGFGANEPHKVHLRGAVFRIERQADEFSARWIAPIAIYPCESARDEISEPALAAALEKGGWERVTRLYRHNDVPQARCWVSAPGWCLAYG